jgi:hypothetical protein
VIDALTYAVRDAIRGAGINYDAATCEIMDDGRPPPRCGNYFAAIHGFRSRSERDNQLYERYDGNVTLTMRVTIPLDRVGDKLISLNLARVPQAERNGFNAKAERLRALLHMNWGMVVLTGQTPASANDNLSAWATGVVYGFVEPLRYLGPDADPVLVGGEWFAADPDAQEFGIRQTLQFGRCLRFQPQTLPVGPFA